VAQQTCWPEVRESKFLLAYSSESSVVKQWQRFRRNIAAEIDYAESEKDNWLERYDAECKGAPGPDTCCVID